MPADTRTHAGPPPTPGPGDWLCQWRIEMEQGEAAWLKGLAHFDDAGDWAHDGALSCVDWLVMRAGLTRATAFDKLRMAHELRRRPVLAEAFADGRISYSAARAITRLVGPPEPVDRALIEFARSRPVAAVERAVRYCHALITADGPAGEDRESSRE